MKRSGAMLVSTNRIAGNAVVQLRSASAANRFFARLVSRTKTRSRALRVVAPFALTVGAAEFAEAVLRTLNATAMIANEISWTNSSFGLAPPISVSIDSLLGFFHGRGHVHVLSVSEQLLGGLCGLLSVWKLVFEVEAIMMRHEASNYEVLDKRI